MQLVSIIIPAYNSEKYIKETLDSILAQTYTNWECIVVDNDSTDSTIDIVMSYQDRRFQLYIETNPGASFCRNLGINKAKGNYIAFLDSDDIWHPERLTVCMNYLHNNKIQMVYSNYSLIDENSVSLNKLIKVPTDLSTSELFIENYVGTSSNVVVKKAAIPTLSNGDYFYTDLKMREDHELWLRICKNNLIRGINQNLLYYRITPNSQQSYLANHTKEWKRFLEKVYYANPFLQQYENKAESYQFKSIAIRAYRNKDWTSTIKYLLLSIIHYPSIIKDYVRRTTNI